MSKDALIPPYYPEHVQSTPVDPVRARIIAILEVILCSSVPTQLALGVAMRLAGWPATDAEGHLSLSYVLTLSLADTALLIALMVALTRAHGESPSELWIGSRGITREALVGVMLVPIVFATVIVLLNLIRLVAPTLHNIEENPLEQLARTPAQAALFGIVAIVAGGVREELQRAFLLRRFEQHLGGPLMGVIVLSVGFGLGHVVQGWDAVLTTGMLGALWAVVYLRRRSSIAPIVSHAGFNGLEVLRAALMA